MKKEADKINEKTIVEARPDDWNRKIKEVKCGKITAERRKICVENYEKTTGNKIGTDYEEEASLEVKKRQK